MKKESSSQNHSDSLLIGVALLSGVCLMLIAALVEYVATHNIAALDKFHLILPTILFSFGGTLVSASLVIFFVDRRSRILMEKTISQKLKDIERNVFEAVYGFDVDARFNLTLRQQIFENNFVRYDYKVVCEHSVVDDEKGIRIRSDNLATYRIKNNGNESHIYKIPAVMLATGENDQEQGKVNFIRTQDGDIHKDKYKYRTKNKYRYLDGVEILIPPKTDISVEMSVTAWKKPFDCDVWFHGTLCDGMYISYVLGREDASCLGRAFHANETTFPEVDATPGNVKNFSISGPILPHQGICVSFSYIMNDENVG